MNLGEHVSSGLFNTTNGMTKSFDDFHGKWVVLYFYPKDATPGCTLEGQDFRDQYPKFTARDTVVLGISRDSLKSHENFKAKQQFPFELISDSDEQLCQQFAVIKMKSMYGKQVRGIERSTFLIDPNGVIQHVWRGVRVDGHVNDVLTQLESLQST